MLDELRQGNTYRLTEIPDLDDVETSLTPLALAYERLGLMNSVGQLRLS